MPHRMIFRSILVVAVALTVSACADSPTASSSEPGRALNGAYVGAGFSTSAASSAPGVFIGPGAASATADTQPTDSTTTSRAGVLIGSGH